MKAEIVDSAANNAYPPPARRNVKNRFVGYRALYFLQIFENIPIVRMKNEREINEKDLAAWEITIDAFHVLLQEIVVI